VSEIVAEIDDVNCRKLKMRERADSFKFFRLFLRDRGGFPAGCPNQHDTLP
jgi:hypothetical protein